MKQEDIMGALKACLEEKGKRKFTQSVEFIVNFKGVDFTKQDARLNLSIPLPNGTGKKLGLAVFADGQLGMDAKKMGADVVMSGAEIPELAKDKVNITDMLNKSKKDFAYNIIDIDGAVTDDVLAKLKAVEGVIAVRLI